MIDRLEFRFDSIELQFVVRIGVLEELETELIARLSAYNLQFSNPRRYSVEI